MQPISRACAITAATDETEDDHITCFKPTGSIAIKRLNILRNINLAKDVRNDYKDSRFLAESKLQEEEEKTEQNMEELYGFMADSDGEDDHSEKALKVVLLGDSSCGKTALCHRFTQHTFPQKYTQTVGVDFFSRRITLPTNISALLQIWDVGGHNISSTKMLNTYIYGAHAVLFVYDVTNTQSFENLTDWIQLAKKVSRNLEKPFHMALLGNKTDMEHRRVVRIERHNKAAEQHSLEPHYVSAKTGDSVELMFKTVAAEVLGLRLSKAEKEWNISVVQAQIPASEAKSPINKSGNNLLLASQQKAAQATIDSSSSNVKPSSASASPKSSAQAEPQVTNNKNSAVCSLQ